MDSRNVNVSIKKSQIDTHMLGLAQKLTKLDIALEGQVFAWDSGSGSQKMTLNELLFTFYMYLPLSAPPIGIYSTQRPL